MIETKLNGATADLVEEKIFQLRKFFPEVFTEQKIDFEKLQQVLGKNIETESERYHFTWNGKSQALRLAQSTSTGTLRPCPEESKDLDTTENIYIEGDNLEVLKLLQKSYHGKVKMIYIDPPYNTGNDFVYPDNYRDNLQNYLELTGQVDSDNNKISTNREASGRYHTDWLNMIYPRLKLARNLLRDDGVIFISIDDNEQANLKKICDEIFGEDNFVSQLIWQKKTGASDAKDIAIITEYILVYVKSRQNIGTLFTKNSGSYDLNRYKYQDKYFNTRGPYYIDNLDRGGLQYSDSLNYGIKCPDGKITFPNGRTEYYNDGWTWKWSKQKIEWARENAFIEFRKSTNKISGWSVCYKNYLFVDNEGNKIDRAAPHKNLINGVLNANASNDMKMLFNSNLFSYSKPVELIENLLSFVKTENDLILDFFSGSATTAHAVMELNAEDGGNRRFIMVQLPEPCKEDSEAFKSGYKNICEIGKERIRRAGDKIKNELLAKVKNEPTIVGKDNSIDPSSLDIGFKVLKLTSSNLKKWNPDYSNHTNLEEHLYNSIDNYVEGRTELDIVLEMMLKYGIDLSYPVHEVTIGDKKVYAVAHGMLMVCMADKITMDIANYIVQYKKEHSVEEMRTIFKDNGFASDTDKTNIKEILKCNDIKEFVTV